MDVYGGARILARKPESQNIYLLTLVHFTKHEAIAFWPISLFGLHHSITQREEKLWKNILYIADPIRVVKHTTFSLVIFLEKKNTHISFHLHC